MRHLACSILCAALMMATAAIVEATVCASDASPASSLVFPFVVLDYPDADSAVTTIIGITNTGPDAQIVHITLWTDYGVSILDFNIVLSGYDLQTFNIRDLLVDGVLPISGDPEAPAVFGGVVARGPVAPESLLPSPDSPVSLFDRCNSGSHISVPSNYGPPIPAGTLGIFQVWLQRSQTEPRFHQSCGGGQYSLGDSFETRDVADPTWMWVTADVVWTCNKMLGDDPEYWHDGPTENPTWDQNGAQRFVANVLIGDVTWVDTDTGASESGLAIHLEADRSLGDTSYNSPILNPTTGMPQSFYHTYSSPFGSSDLREPLPTAWAFRYTSGALSGSTWMRVFKAPSLTPDLIFPGLSGGTMLADDCLAYTYYAWDDSGNVVTGGPYVEPNLLPLYTQEVDVANFFIPDGYGWLLFQWPHTNAAVGDLYQTWVEVRTEPDGFEPTVRPAVPMANFNCDRGFIMGSGLELGNTSGWSATKP